MTTKDFFRKIFAFKLWANLAAMLLVVVLLCFGVKTCIDIYTHHGENIVIPNLKHKLFSDAEHILEQRGLKIVVRDTGYVKNLPADCILEQIPEAGKGVKEGRTVYVTINASQARMIQLPDIIDNCSYREARARLIGLGFRVGPAEYIPGEKDWVYGLKSKGRNLQTGQKVSVNDLIIIQVGDGMRDMEDSVIYADPSYYSDGYTDSLGIYHQPEPSHDSGTDQGGDVDEFEVVTAPE